MMRVTRNLIMRHLVAALCAISLLVTCTPGFAARIVPSQSPFAGTRSQMQEQQSRIPAPLPQPAQPPAINGPLTPSGLPPMGVPGSQ
jgi:hypothetical protein